MNNFYIRYSKEKTIRKTFSKLLKQKGINNLLHTEYKCNKCGRWFLNIKNHLRSYVVSGCVGLS